MLTIGTWLNSDENECQLKWLSIVHYLVWLIKLIRINVIYIKLKYIELELNPIWLI